MDGWWVYIIDRAGRYYTGITTDITNRMRQHHQSAPLHQEGPMARAAAVHREREIKGWSRQKKEALIAKASEQKVSLP